MISDFNWTQKIETQGLAASSKVQTCNKIQNCWINKLQVTAKVLLFYKHIENWKGFANYVEAKKKKHF